MKTLELLSNVSVLNKISTQKIKGGGDLIMGDVLTITYNSTDVVTIKEDLKDLNLDNLEITITK